MGKMRGLFQAQRRCDGTGVAVNRPEIRSLLKAFIKVNLKFDKGAGMKGID
jgi:hypothetical protein